MLHFFKSIGDNMQFVFAGKVIERLDSIGKQGSFLRAQLYIGIAHALAEYGVVYPKVFERFRKTKYPQRFLVYVAHTVSLPEHFVDLLIHLDKFFYRNAL